MSRIRGRRRDGHRPIEGRWWEVFRPQPGWSVELVSGVIAMVVLIPLSLLVPAEWRWPAYIVGSIVVVGAAAIVGIVVRSRGARP
jgi:hypothetical protein